MNGWAILAILVALLVALALAGMEIFPARWQDNAKHTAFTLLVALVVLIYLGFNDTGLKWWAYPIFFLSVAFVWFVLLQLKPGRDFRAEQ